MARGYKGRSGLSAQRGRVGSGRLGSRLEEEEEVLLVPRRIERTLCSLLGGVGVTEMGDGLEASTMRSSLLTCCCLTSRRDCSIETKREKERERRVRESSPELGVVLLVPRGAH